MLYIHTSNHLEELQKQYAELIKTPLDDVFQTETVVVQNAGMARWLSIEMANDTGISANTEYLFPAEYMWRLLRQISPDIPEHSECAPDALRFHIYDEFIKNVADYPELHHYIVSAQSDKETKRSDSDNSSSATDDHYNIDYLSAWELACQTARLLDQYLFYRNEWIDDWEASTTSSQASQKNHSNHWQARLWNRCVKDKGLLHWLALQKQFAKDIETFDASQLNQRVSFFSMSALSPGYVDLLTGISKKIDIHIFIINPCGDVYWGDIQSPKAHSKLDEEAQYIAEIGHPLLASLGKQGRDFIDKLLDIQDQGVSDTDRNNQLNNDSLVNDQTSLLSQIQKDIYHLEAPYIFTEFDKTDNSIQLHSCHTAMREVEVLYDQILAQLDNDTNLSPSDIVVMMPDIEKYAPYIEAVFGKHFERLESDSKRIKTTLPFSIADRDPQNIFKTVQALNKLFCLSDARFDVEAVFEILEYDDIRNHFGLSEDELRYCRELALESNIRWGISAKSRKVNNLPYTEEHTWKYALDKMLLGYSLASDNNDTNALFPSNRELDLLPFSEIEGSQALILAKFKKCTDILFSINEWQKYSHTLDKWIVKTTQLLQQLSPENSDQARILNVFADIKVKADLADFNQKLPYSVYQKLLQQSLAEISANEKYLGYGITFCALVPMRSVPFKLVALIGMNDGEFPRQDSRLSFNLMAKKTRRGDRSRRDEDRYLFLESLLASRSKLYISYIGQSIKDNTELPPSILVSELLDTITLQTNTETENWITKHPLQAFSQRYFSANNDKQHPLFSYSSQYLNTNQSSEASFNPNFVDKPLDALDDSFKSLSLIDLINFYKNPSRAFLSTRFGIKTYDQNDELNIREPFTLESFKDQEIRKLVLHEISESEASDLVSDLVSNIDNDLVRDNDDYNKQIARAKGLLPYGEIGDSAFSKEAHLTRQYQQQLPEKQPDSDQHFSLAIGDFNLHCSIDNLSDIGRVIEQVAKPYASDHIALWLTHLCINASDTIANKQSQFYSPEESFLLKAVEDAKAILKQILDYYWQGLHYPLQFFPKSSFALYANDGKKNINKMSDKWNGNDKFAGEKDSFEHALLHRNLALDKDQQPEQCLEISEVFFGQMFNHLEGL